MMHVQKNIKRFKKFASVVILVPDNGLEQYYRGADKSLARPGRKQSTPTEDFEYQISYL